MNFTLEKKIQIILNIVALLLVLGVAYFVCTQKMGMHEDEYYSYYSSNRTDGLWISDKFDTGLLKREIMVLNGEKYRFSLVKEVQSWDVHPPIYYFVLHLICSLSPERFSMWNGLGLNLVCFIVSIILMKKLGVLLLDSKEGSGLFGKVLYTDIFILLICLAWGISAAVLSGVVFIRMYMLLSVWVLAVTILHLQYIDEEFDNGLFYIELACLTFCGFMTHYYFFIWLFFLAIGFNIVRLKRGLILEIIKYGITMVATFIVCYLFYPAWPAQMFHGQRGAQATGNFLDLNNTWDRIIFFAEKINRIGFGSILVVLIGVFFLLLIILCEQKHQYKKNLIYINELEIHAEENIKGGLNAKVWILIGACIGYFLIISKTALLLGDTSIRYQMPILSVMYLTVFAVLVFTIERIMHYRRIAQILDSGENLRVAMIVGSFIALILIIFNIWSDMYGNISFLYTEEKDHMEIIENHKSANAVYVYSVGNEWCIWSAANELMEYDSVEFISGDWEEIHQKVEAMMGNEDWNKNSSEIMLFVDSAVDINAVLHAITKYDKDISTFEYQFSDAYCDVYLGF